MDEKTHIIEQVSDSELSEASSYIFNDQQFVIIWRAIWGVVCVLLIAIVRYHLGPNAFIDAYVKGAVVFSAIVWPIITYRHLRHKKIRRLYTAVDFTTTDGERKKDKLLLWSSQFSEVAEFLESIYYQNRMLLQKEYENIQEWVIVTERDRHA